MMRGLAMALALQVLGLQYAVAGLKSVTDANEAEPAAVTPVAMAYPDCDTNDRAKDKTAQGISVVRQPIRGTPLARLDADLTARARAGDASAAWRAALASFRGDCRAPNYGEALGYVQTASRAGHACATGAWGLMLVRGWGVARDLPQARELLERSAQAGCARALYWAWLMDAYAVRPQARESALEHLARGAELGDGHALNALGIVREVDARRDEARALYTRAANAGNATARMNLARLARYFSQSIEKPSLAVLTQRAESGQAEAQYLLARRLHQGDGVAVNYVQALQWYQKSAQKGFAASREMLALVQARLGVSAAPSAMVLADLSLIDVSSDELNKKRGVVQPIEDIDPFAGL
jgi:TPR repeat protein